ncbi:oligosaccharide flippase family protein [Kineococcus aurantiacus]|uniref:O-antigen/teichoic acid export membrane protein n=1 Tax=Kineococcus aurantiacus TaxID=37633 RepID=A0A7Y9AT18_9ACTN|nr:oligosaccharide flippase family protein [Kineococcus aurantiacus]NYD21006.1 O-antigen/teichoic acid export membrane protein [Kineococcus aurantiacus]
MTAARVDVAPTTAAAAPRAGGLSLRTGRRAPRSTGAHASGLLTVANVAIGVLNYLYSLSLTHLMPAAQYTVFAAVLSVLIIQGTIGSAGVPWVLARDLALRGDDPSAARRSVTFAFWLNLWSGALLAGLVALVCASFASSGAVVVTSLTAFLLAVSSTGAGWLQGHRRTNLIAVLKLSEVVVKVVTGILLARATSGSAAMVLLASLLGCLVLFASFPSFARSIGRPTSVAHTADLWVSAARIGGLQIGVAVIGAADSLVVTMVSAAASDTAAYQAASTLGRVPLFVSTAVSTAVFPLLVRENSAKARSRALISYLLVSCFGWVVLVTVPPAVLGALFPSEFSTLRNWLAFTAPLGVLAGLLNLVSTFEQARVDSWHPHLVLGGAALLYVSAISLAGHFGGLTAFAVATLAGAVVAVGAVVLLPSQRSVPVELVAALHPWVYVVAAVVVGALVFAPGPVWWLVVTALAGATVACVAFPEFQGLLPQCWQAVLARVVREKRGRHRR